MLHTSALVFGLHLWLCDTVPPGPQHAVHILVYYVKYDSMFTCKRIYWGTMFKKIFFLFSVCLVQKVAINGSKIKQYI